MKNKEAHEKIAKKTDSDAELAAMAALNETLCGTRYQLKAGDGVALPPCEYSTKLRELIDSKPAGSMIAFSVPNGFDYEAVCCAVCLVAAGVVEAHETNLEEL